MSREFRSVYQPYGFLFTRMEEFVVREEAPVVAICAALESDISGLSDEERLEFLADAGLAEPGLNRLIRAAYQILRLQTYLAAGMKKVRAWTIHVGDTASQASSMAILRGASSALSGRLRRLPRLQGRGGRE
jgi:ribosome-binding ATPase YchF (GTP1/OBG family)